jgi:hypothetical protein
MLLSLLALWALVFPGFRWCLGVNGPKFGPKFPALFSGLSVDSGRANSWDLRNRSPEPGGSLVEAGSIRPVRLTAKLERGGSNDLSTGVRQNPGMSQNSRVP